MQRVSVNFQVIEHNLLKATNIGRIFVQYQQRLFSFSGMIQVLKQNTCTERSLIYADSQVKSITNGTVKLLLCIFFLSKFRRVFS